VSRLIPELDVAGLDRSLAFYVGVVGFNVLYDRPEERFAFLDLAGARLMLEELGGSGRRFLTPTAPLERPYGLGVNFQIEVANVDALHDRVRRAGFDPVIPFEERWYRRGEMESGNRQLVVADPDGDLLRFFSDLGQRVLPW
jgi:catechol 2,3-dioxygenase-like lactoylglutathione lyase family enzyme